MTIELRKEKMMRIAEDIKDMQLQDVLVEFERLGGMFLDVDVSYHLEFEAGERYPIVHVDDVIGFVARLQKYISVRHEVVNMASLEQRLEDQVIENMWAEGELP